MENYVLYSKTVSLTFYIKNEINTASPLFINMKR